MGYNIFLSDIVPINAINQIKELSLLLKIDKEWGVNKRVSNNLSSGEKKKISLLRVLVKSASVIVLDEPTIALDEKTVCNLLKYLTSIKRNCIIIIVAHDARVEKICDNIIAL